MALSSPIQACASTQRVYPQEELGDTGLFGTAEKHQSYSLSSLDAQVIRDDIKAQAEAALQFAETSLHAAESATHERSKAKHATSQVVEQLKELQLMMQLIIAICESSTPFHAYNTLHDAVMQAELERAIVNAIKGLEKNNLIDERAPVKLTVLSVVTVIITDLYKYKKVYLKKCAELFLTDNGITIDMLEPKTDIVEHAPILALMDETDDIDEKNTVDDIEVQMDIKALNEIIGNLELILEFMDPKMDGGTVFDRYTIELAEARVRLVVFKTLADTQ